MHFQALIVRLRSMNAHVLFDYVLIHCTVWVKTGTMPIKRNRNSNLKQNSQMKAKMYE